MYAIKVIWRGQANILPYRYGYYDQACRSAASRREMAQGGSSMKHEEVRCESYQLLEERAGCDLKPG